MVDDILDKIVVPDARSTKGDVFKKEEKREDRREREEKFKDKQQARPQERINDKIQKKKEIFRKSEFDRKPVSFNIKTPGLIERGIYILIILVLFYFAFFQNINFDFGNIFSGDAQSLVTKSNDDKSETKEEVVEEKTTEEAVKEEELSGDITLTISDVKTEKYETGISKINGFTFNVDNQKKEFTAKIKYYAYDSSTPAVWMTKERGESAYVMPVGTTKKDIDTKVIFSTSSIKTLRVELYDNDKIIANITKEVAIS